VDATDAATCTDCGGRGRLRVGKGPVAFTRTCPRCGGQGKTGTRPCGQCGGSGQRLGTERLTVHIPPGVDTGSRVRVAGKGAAGDGGGPAGDLFIHVRVRPHPLLERRGDDLHMDLPLTLPEAVLGATIQVPTPDGEVRVRVPPGSQTGRQLRVKGHGVPHLRGKGRGDLYLRIVIHAPDELGDAVREAVRRLEPAYGRNPRQDLRL
jgi:molecular chaperone DnaJ